jgi:Ni/Co efflux regulator RcnB
MSDELVITPEEVAAHEAEQREYDLLLDAEKVKREEREVVAQEAANAELLDELAAAAAERRQTNAQRGIAPGGSFYLDLPEQLSSIWGDDIAPLWIEGEGCSRADARPGGEVQYSRDADAVRRRRWSRGDRLPRLRRTSTAGGLPVLT